MYRLIEVLQYGPQSFDIGRSGVPRFTSCHNLSEQRFDSCRNTVSNAQMLISTFVPRWGDFEGEAVVVVVVVAETDGEPLVVSNPYGDPYGEMLDKCKAMSSGTRQVPF